MENSNFYVGREWQSRAFKPNTDDMDEAVSIQIVRGLLKRGARIVAYDPKALKTAKRIFRGHVEYAGNVQECLKETHAAILVTEWGEFKQITPQQFRRPMRKPLSGGSYSTGEESTTRMR